MDVVFLIGRILFGLLFVSSALMAHLIGYKQGVQYARMYINKNFALFGAALVIFYVFNQLQGDAGLSLTDPLFGKG